MDRRIRRLCWGLVVAALALSGLSACSFSSLFGAGAGLGFAGFLTALLLLLGTTTQTGCGPCLSIAVPGEDAGADVGPCLSMPPDAQVGPCLSPDTGVGMCLSIEEPRDAGAPADADLGPCLSPPLFDAGAPDTGVGMCLSIEEPRDAGAPADADLGPCLSPPIDSDASAEARPPSRPAGPALASGGRQEVLERLADRLPDDVKERLGLKKA